MGILTLYHELGSLVVLDFEEADPDVMTLDVFLIILIDIWEEYEDDFIVELEKLGEVEIPVVLVKIMNIVCTVYYVFGEIHRRLGLKIEAERAKTSGHVWEAAYLRSYAHLSEIRITEEGRREAEMRLHLEHDFIRRQKEWFIRRQREEAKGNDQDTVE